jgi:ABC-type sugar transport system permease subunit
MLSLSFLGIVLPNHPFDYLYNYILRRWMKAPRVPARSKQLKFACIIATVFLVAVVGLLYVGMVTQGLIAAGFLTAFALLPSTIDLCIPSLIYNGIFQNRRKSDAMA